MCVDCIEGRAMTDEELVTVAHFTSLSAVCLCSPIPILARFRRPQANHDGQILSQTCRLLQNSQAVGLQGPPRF